MNKMLLAGLALVAVMTSCGGTMTTPLTNTYKATLTGGAENPPVTTTGTDTVAATLNINTKVLTISGSYTGLTGAVTAPGALASGAHIHGPTATPNANAGVLFNLTATAGATAGSGTVAQTTTITLTDAQITDINDGKFYVNLHTVANPSGEIRGQLIKQ